MKRARKKPAAKAKAKAKAGGRDARLIRECVRYAQAAASEGAGFGVDPTGGNDFAGAASDAYLRVAEDALRFVSKTAPETPAGLLAKVRLVPMVLNYQNFAGIDRYCGAFFVELSKQMGEFLQPIAHGHMVVAPKPTAQS